MQNTNHNPVCDFSGELVSYLYDEIKPREKIVFESHLAKCRSCAGELAAFSEVHTVLGDWRENVFVPLETPEILISYNPSPARVAALEEPSSWLDRFRAGFGFSFAWPAAAASILLAVVASAWFFSFGSAHQNEIAAGHPAPEIPEQVIASPANPGELPRGLELPAEVQLPAVKIKAPAENQTNTVAVRQPVVKQKSPTVRNIDLPVRNAPLIRIKQPAETVAVNQQRNVNPPALLGDDDDNKDDSLRLSELFDESDEEN